MSSSELYVDIFGTTYADSDSELGEMAAKVASQNFDYRYATLLLFNSTFYYGVEIFLRVYNYNIIINKDGVNSEFTKMSRQFVIYVTDVADMEPLLETLRAFQMDNTGKFIIVCQSRESYDCNEKIMMKWLWEYRIVNVVFVKPVRKLQAAGFTYYPVSNGICNNIKPVKVDASNGQYVTTSQGKIFSMKLRKLSFCPLYVSTFLQPPFMYIKNGRPSGSDGDLLRIIANGLNTTLKMITPHRGTGWGFRQKNGTWMGSLADLSEDLANISMTSPALTNSRYSDFQASRSYFSVQLVWVTHPATLQNEAFKLLHPLGKRTRIALILSYVIVIFGAFLVKYKVWPSYFSKSLPDKPSKSIVFYSWMICTGQTVLKLPTKSFFLQITYLWIYYCFIIRTVYQVYLISSLKGKFYEDQFETIEDAIKAQYPFGGNPALQDYYIDNPTIYDNWIHIDSAAILPTVMELSEGKRFVLAMNADTAKLIMKQNKISLHVLPQKLINSPTGIFFKKYSPLAESINIILSRLISAGLPEKLHKNYTSYKEIEENCDQEALKIIHLAACYAILIIGWIVSFIFFLLEFYFGRLYKHPKLLASLK